MRIAIINLTGGGMSGGYRKYLKNILPKMAVHHDVEAILCASPKSLNIQDWFDNVSNVSFVTCKSHRFLNNSPDSQLSYVLEKLCPDVIFIPMERYLYFRGTPVVNMVRNMEPLIPGITCNSISEKIRKLAQYLESRRAVNKANRVIAVSEFVFNFLVKKWNVSLEKIGLCYYGRDICQNKGHKRPDFIHQNFRKPFIFTAGSIRPSRGIEDLLMSLKHLKLHWNNSFYLVIAGDIAPKMMGYWKKMQNYIQLNNLSDKIFWGGLLNEKDMSWCYHNCDLFIMTSRVESFGNISVEAMSHGCICIAADNPCLPEIFGDAAIFYPPKNPHILAQRIHEVLNWTEYERLVMKKKALKRSYKFSWNACVDQTLIELKKAIKDNKKWKLA